MTAVRQWLRERFSRPARAPIQRAEAGPAAPRLALEFLGATAGVGALMTLAGGALLWVRFDHLELPADRIVTLLPPELLATVGAHALLVATIAGLMAVVAIYALDDRSELVLGAGVFAVVFVVVLMLWDDWWGVSFDSDAILPVAVAFVLALAAGLCTYSLSLENARGMRPEGIGRCDRPMVVTLGVVGAGVLGLMSQVGHLRVFPWLVVVVAVVAFSLAAIYRGTADRPERSRRPILWMVFAVYLVAGTAVALVRTGADPKLEPIAVLLGAPEQEIAGFYVGESGDEIHIAQLRRGTADEAVSAEAVDAMVSVARERVTRKAMRAPAGLGEDDAGREQAETLLADLVAERAALSGEQPATTPIPTRAPERTFAPLVSLHHAEPIAPGTAEDFLRSSRLLWAFRGCQARARQLAAALSTPAQWRDLGEGGFRQGARCGEGDEYTTADVTRPFSRRTFSDRADLVGREGFYLDLDDAARTPRMRTGTQGRQRVLKPVPVYFERHDELGDDGITNVRITYWFFYPHSTPTGQADATGLKLGHEGDWERISVLTRRVDDASWLPLSVRFHEHSTSVDVPWARARKVADETGVVSHPRAYVAKGSHATYSHPGRFAQILSRGGREILAVRDDARACVSCPLWYTWRSGMLVDAEQQPWYGFGGAWGVVGSASDFTGPLGPSIGKTRQGRAPSPETALQRAPAVTPGPAAPAGGP
ncbi:MAG: hypothetical protein Q8K79_12235 [Solirubrobacteraceae bacterium]|nr:hypothetical protein [Solirubrobacteraceae bacterium]